jgi:hypothetical protein
MTMRVVAFVMMAALLAGSSAASAQINPRHSVRGALGHPRPLAHQGVAYRFAARPRPPITSLSPATPSALHSLYEREGLTRNPDACAVWGCIGNN